MSDTPEWPDIKIVPRFCGQPYISFHKSDTPETDALRDMLLKDSWQNAYFKMRVHAEQLERERNELRRVVSACRPNRFADS